MWLLESREDMFVNHGALRETQSVMLVEVIYKSRLVFSVGDIRRLDESSISLKRVVLMRPMKNYLVII